MAWTPTTFGGSFRCTPRTTPAVEAARFRGVFGTGKAAAFGIGTSLQVETVRNGHKWVVRLDRNELVAAGQKSRKPQIKTIEDGKPDKGHNGTTIIIDGVTKAVYRKSVGKELQRRLSRHLRVHNVVVFGEPVHLVEPSARRSWTFVAADDPGLASVIGWNVECTIHAALSPVDEELRGVIVTASEFPVGQISSAGDHATRIFGHCEVPILDSDSSMPGPYTDARDLTLNEDNAIAGPLSAWVRRCLAKVVSDLTTEEREQRRKAQDAALRSAASRMENVLNRHFRGEFSKARNPVGDIAQKTNGVPGEDGRLVKPGSDFAGYELSDQAPRDGDSEAMMTGGAENDKDASSAPSTRLQDRDPFGEGRGLPLHASEGPRQRRQSGGFKILFEYKGHDAPRSNYLPSQLVILLNLDHPELAAAYKDGDTPLFRMLVFEAAAQEYSFGTAYKRIEDDESIDPSDIVEYVRGTMEMLTRDVADIVGDLAAIPLVSTVPVVANA